MRKPARLGHLGDGGMAVQASPDQVPPHPARQTSDYLAGYHLASLRSVIGAWDRGRDAMRLGADPLANQPNSPGRATTRKTSCWPGAAQRDQTMGIRRWLSRRNLKLRLGGLLSHAVERPF